MNTASMPTYEQLREHPREFLATTGLTVEEFNQLLPAYQRAYEQCYPRHLTTGGGERRRRPGGGRKGVLDRDVDRLLFILVYVKMNPLQAMQGQQFGLSQPQANYWIHHLLPALEAALCQVGMTSEWDSRPKATGEGALEGRRDFASDDAEHRRQHAQDVPEQGGHYEERRRTLAEKSLSLLNESVDSSRLRFARSARRVPASDIPS